MIFKEQKQGQTDQTNIQISMPIVSATGQQFKLIFEKAVLVFDCTQEKIINAKNKILSLKQKTTQLMNGNSLSIYSGAFNQYHQLLFRYMIQNQFTSLNIARNKQQNMLKYIFFPIYKDLTYLNLNGNNIKNLQALAWLNMPVLSKLLLEQNLICRVKSFKKWSNKQVASVHIYHNPISQIQPISFIFEQQIIKDLTLQYKQNCPFIAISQDISKLIKLKGRFCNELQIRQARRIIQTRVQLMIKKKFKQFTLLTHLTDDYQYV